ncbi:GntR family transcriptional regulator [Bacillus massiliigorillae]|uniref:GntR family transcriptional regulator n=1 Tax=Bacillus massiliigorillae TaxID=1243664 RepID=UPI0005AB0111|nr:GntR family transcriptional regulator [Bacillus massiliigorillae]
MYTVDRKEVSIIHSVKKGSTLKSQVYEFLRERIMLGQLKPGERLIETTISNELSVSRSPIREAIRMLEKDGLLIVHSSGGVTVVQPTIKDFQSLYECRIELEPVVAYYAALRRSPKQLETIKQYLMQMGKVTEDTSFKKVHDASANFHEAIATASNNPFLRSMVMQFRGITSFYRKVFLEETPHHAEAATREHQQIFLSIEKQDAKEAKHLMKTHIENDYNLFSQLNRKILEDGK